MKKIPFLLAFLFFCMAVPAASHSAAVPTERVLIGFNGRADIHQLEKYGITVHHVFNNISTVSATIPTAARDQISGLSNVKWVESDKAVQAESQVKTTGLSKVKSSQAEKLGLTGKGVKVAIIDTGINLHHPDLHVAGGVSVVHYTKSYNDDNGHGTHVAGIIGALNNSIGVVGVAPNVSLYAVKALDKEGDGNQADIIAGIEWSIKHHMNIVNLSITSSQGSKALEAEVKKAYSKGILIVAAAGNKDQSNSKVKDILYPARYSSVIGVGSVNSSSRRSSFSFYGKNLEFVAPGENIFSTFIDPHSKTKAAYARDTGTSMATPYVTGVLALYRQAYPYLSNDSIRKLAEKNARDLGAKGKDIYYGYGMIQAPKVPFTDVNPSAKQTSYVVELYKKGIIKANRDGSYYPSRDVTKAEAITMIAKVKGWKPIPGKTVFKDVSSTNAAASYINAAESRHIIHHRSDGTLKPNYAVTRADVAFMLQKAFHNPITKKQEFKDVKSGSYYFEQANSLKINHITDGYTDGTFRPWNGISRYDFDMYLVKEMQR